MSYTRHVTALLTSSGFLFCYTPPPALCKWMALAPAQRSASGGPWPGSETTSPPRTTSRHLQRSTRSYDVPVLGPSLTGVGSWCELRAALFCTRDQSTLPATDSVQDWALHHFLKWAAHFNSWLLWMSTITTLWTPIFLPTPHTIQLANSKSESERQTSTL